MTKISVVPIERLELIVKARPWPFADERRREIDAYFAALRRKRPALWNGPVLLLHEFAVTDGIFRGAYFETDFASLLAWRDWDFPDRGVRNCFAMGALRANDGAFLLGVMAAHTANAGRIYFPAGTPDPGDIVGALVDLDGSVRREVAEETGLAADTLHADSGWHAVLAEPRIALMKVLHARKGSEEVRRRILDYLAAENEPELADIRVVRGPDDLDPSMPAFVTAFLAHMWCKAPQ
jgi:8-oxo-dGTP pyrophosphatase MutT (NUDIX family)